MAFLARDGDTAPVTDFPRAGRAALLACLLPACLQLAGCAGTPPADWQLGARDGLASYQGAYFSGSSRAAAGALQLARRELSATGRPALVAHAELYACALRVAALDFDDCPGFLALAADAAPAERDYARYLAGDWRGLQSAALPGTAQAAIRGGSAALAGIAEPVSRLVAAGALLRAGRMTPEGITLAIDTASAQGWRRPLLAWLGVALARAEAAGDAPAAAQLKRRIALAAESALQ
jgi:hypothetical protein